jgi:hypothetical protein
MINTIWLIRFLSTGESWNTCVCKDIRVAKRELDSRGLTEVYFASTGRMINAVNPDDRTQTAIAVEYDITE